MTPERAKQILAQSKYAELQMSPSEGDYINKIFKNTHVVLLEMI